MFNYQCDEDYQKIKDVSQNYPQLTTFEKEWLFFDRYGYIPGIPVELEYQTIQTNDNATVLNAIPYQYKSAILKGQTLVNLSNISSSDIISINNISFDISLRFKLKNLTTYTAIFNVVTLETPNDAWCGFMGNNGWGSATKTYKIGINKIAFTTYENSDCGRLRLRGTNNAFKNLIILEGDYTNVDIPYFDGMQSVKMPVLTSTGKNLFNIEDNTHVLTKLENGNYRSIPFKSFNLPKFKEKTSYTLSFSVSEFHDGTYQFPEIIYTDGTKLVSYQADKTFNGNPAYILTSDSTKTISHIDFSYGINSVILEFVHFQIEEGSNSTSYEPFKSNILTVNEEVELRGIGDVQDTLDCLTGEVTERVLEYTITGDEGWIKHSTTNTFLTMDGIVKYSGNKRNVISDKFIGRYVPSNTWLANMEICVFGSKIGIGFDGTLEELIEYLKLNNPRIFYVDEEKSVKTVDLTSSLTNPFEGVNHYQVSSDTINPTFICEVPIVSEGEQTLAEINQATYQNL